MKKFGWGILFVFMLLLVWNTRVAVPNSAEAIGFDLWALFLVSLTFFVGWKLWFQVFPKRAALPVPTPLHTTRLSETKEIQEAFQREMIALFNEAGASEGLPLIQTPANVKEILDGKEFLDRLDKLEKRGSLQTLGFKPEQARVLKTMTYLLAECARIEATPANLAVFLPLFKPGKPTTETVADAYDEVVKAMTGCIEPGFNSTP